MKICPKCGVSQKDSNNLCIDCGAPLGKPIDEDAAYYIEKERRDKIDGLSYNLDELSMGRLKVPFICAFLLGIVGSIVLLLLSGADIIRCNAQHWLLYSIVFSALGLIGTLFPQLSWKLELMRLSWYIDTSEASPSYWYIFTHKLMVWLSLILTVAFIGVFFMDGEKHHIDDNWPNSGTSEIIAYGATYGPNGVEYVELN